MVSAGFALNHLGMRDKLVSENQCLGRKEMRLHPPGRLQEVCESVAWGGCRKRRRRQRQTDRGRKEKGQNNAYSGNVGNA